jgi:hypothetical protein
MEKLKELVKAKPVMFAIGALIVLTLAYHWLWSDAPV